MDKDCEGENYEILLEKYNTLFKKHEQLKYDCLENTVIESMKDMKNTFELQDAKINKLHDKLYVYSNNIKSVILMINIFKKNSIDDSLLLTYPIVREMSAKLDFIIEILESNLHINYSNNIF